MACAFGHAHWQLVYKSAPGEGQTVTAVTVLSLLKGKKKAADAGEVSRPAAFCLLSGGGGLLGVDWLKAAARDRWKFNGEIVGILPKKPRYFSNNRQIARFEARKSDLYDKTQKPVSYLLEIFGQFWAFLSRPRFHRMALADFAACHHGPDRLPLLCCLLPQTRSTPTKNTTKNPHKPAKGKAQRRKPLGF